MKKLYRSQQNKVVAGLIGGLGEYANVDPVMLRVVFVVFLILTGVFPLALVYVIAVFIVPQKPAAASRSTSIDQDA